MTEQDYTDPQEIVPIVEEGRLVGYRYRRWEIRNPEIATWLTASQRYPLKRSGRLGPVVDARLRRGLADRTDFVLRELSHHERLKLMQLLT